MADTAVTSRTLSVNTLSAALDSTSTAGTSVSTGNVAVMTPAGGGNTRQVVITMYGSADSTATFAAGDEPPSETSGEGASSALTVANGKAYVVVLEAGRFVQDNGTIRCTVGGTGPVIFNCFTVPRGV